MIPIDAASSGFTCKDSVQLELRTLGGVSSVAFSPDGTHIASASDDGTAKLWEAATGREVLTFRGHSGPISRLAFSPDGRRIASASTDRTVMLWDVATGQEVATLRGHSVPVWGVAFSPDGSRIASVGGDRARPDDPGEMKIWAAATGLVLHAIPVHYTFSVCVAFSPDGRHVATASWDRTVKLWDVATGREVRTFLGHTDACLVAWLSAPTVGSDRLSQPTRPNREGSGTPRQAKKKSLWCVVHSATILYGGVQPRRPPASPPPAVIAR